MPRLLSVLFCFTVALLAMIPAGSIAQNKEDKADKVRIPTVDGVELYGKFYPCLDSKIKTPPTILMLHSIGETSSKKTWVALAESLQKKSAVLTFDFRGHGLSTEVDPSLFWKVQFNIRNIKGGSTSAINNKQTIDHKEFAKAYHPALINDIAAVKAYLDRKNDSGACNTSSFIVLGADTAATLGAVWINSEWHRHKVTQNPVTLISYNDPRAEGKDVIAGIWLSMSSQFGTRTISPASTLDIAMVKNSVPMLFICSDEDTKGKAIASAAVKFAEGKNKAKFPFTGKAEVKAGKLAGMELLQKSTRLDEYISAYLFGNPSQKTDGVVDAKGREWIEKENKKTLYMWRNPGVIPGGPGISAKGIGDTNLYFETYGKYAR